MCFASLFVGAAAPFFVSRQCDRITLTFRAALGCAVAGVLAAAEEPKIRASKEKGWSNSVRQLPHLSKTLGTTSLAPSQVFSSVEMLEMSCGPSNRQGGC